MTTYPKLQVPRLQQEAMREIVRLRMAGQIMFSDEVPESLTGIVFMPLAMGALQPPKEVLVEFLGSEFRPEALKGEPPKPEHPGYQDEAGEPPAKPVLAKLPSKIQSDLEWGYIPEEEREDILRELKEENQKRIRAWEEGTSHWMDLLDSDRIRREEVDATHAEAIRAWEDSLSKHEEAVREREALKADWENKNRELITEWAQDIGVVMGNMKDTFPRGINGFPMFHAIQMIHKEDWVRIRSALIREQERAKEIEV